MTPALEFYLAHWNDVRILESKIDELRESPENLQKVHLVLDRAAIAMEHILENMADAASQVFSGKLKPEPLSRRGVRANWAIDVALKELARGVRNPCLYLEYGLDGAATQGPQVYFCLRVPENDHARKVKTDRLRDFFGKTGIEAVVKPEWNWDSTFHVLGRFAPLTPATTLDQLKEFAADQATQLVNLHAASLVDLLKQSVKADQAAA
jgi:hypothetical protein